MCSKLFDQLFSKLCAEYDYVFAPDDDIRISTEAIGSLVDVARARGLAFASPAFDPASDGVWRYFDVVDPACELRFTNFVENMAVLFRTEFLLHPVFDRCLRATLSGCD